MMTPAKVVINGETIPRSERVTMNITMMAQRMVMMKMRPIS